MNCPREENTTAQTSEHETTRAVSEQRSRTGVTVSLECLLKDNGKKLAAATGGDETTGDFEDDTASKFSSSSPSIESPTVVVYEDNSPLSGKDFSSLLDSITGCEGPSSGGDLSGVLTGCTAVAPLTKRLKLDSQNSPLQRAPNNTSPGTNGLSPHSAQFQPKMTIKSEPIASTVVKQQQTASHTKQSNEDDSAAAAGVAESNNNLAPEDPSAEKPSSRNTNQMGGSYTNGKPLPLILRQKIILMASRGFKASEISKQVKVSHGCISKIVNRYNQTGSMMPGIIGGSKPKVATEDVIAAIMEMKAHSPSIFAWEIREKLIEIGKCTEKSVPSVSSINRVIRQRTSSPSNKGSPQLKQTSKHSSPFEDIHHSSGPQSSVNHVPTIHHSLIASQFAQSRHNQNSNSNKDFASPSSQQIKSTSMSDLSADSRRPMRTISPQQHYQQFVSGFSQQPNSAAAANIEEYNRAAWHQHFMASTAANSREYHQNSQSNTAMYHHAQPQPQQQQQQSIYCNRNDPGASIFQVNSNASSPYYPPMDHHQRSAGSSSSAAMSPGQSSNGYFRHHPAAATARSSSSPAAAVSYMIPGAHETSGTAGHCFYPEERFLHQAQGVRSVLQNQRNTSGAEQMDTSLNKPSIMSPNVQNGPISASGPNSDETGTGSSSMRDHAGEDGGNSVIVQ